MLLKVLRERRPHYFALVFDSKGPTFRHERYPDYKAHRPPMPDELAMQLPYINRIIDGLNLPKIQAEGFEADDLICTLSKAAREHGFQVEIISGDKDLLPLVQEGVIMWDPMKDVRFDSEVIRAKYGLPPQELMDVKALAGDPSDNIPGVPGIGEKTALKLIARYHNLENLLARLDEIKEKKLKERLKEHVEQARLSRELVQLKDDVPLKVDLEQLHPGPPDRETLLRLFVELEFSKLTRELGFEAPLAQGFTLVQQASDLEGAAHAIRQAGETALFFLMGEGHPVMARIAGLGLSWGEGAGAYVPFETSLSTEDIWKVLGPVWTDPAIRKIGPDLKAARLAGERFGQTPAGNHGDLLLASYLLNPARYEQTLENVAGIISG
jgi:DNA polymerase I